MLDERRRDERTEAYDIIRVIAKDAQGREVVLPIMLRDRSKTGLGGVYVGADPLDTSIDYWLEDVDAKLLRLRIAWISPVASHVFIVGFTII